MILIGKEIRRLIYSFGMFLSDFFFDLVFFINYVNVIFNNFGLNYW